MINLLNIERIVLGGGVMDAGALILNPIIHEVKRRAFLRCFEATEIVAAKLWPGRRSHRRSTSRPRHRRLISSHTDLTQFENLDLFGKVKALCNKHSECERFVGCCVSQLLAV